VISKVKKYLGIEGIKIKLDVKSKLKLNGSGISGKIICETMTESSISHIRIKLIEKYQRGRKANQLIDEYVLGETTLHGPFLIEKHNQKILDFHLPYVLSKSEMDRYSEKNFLFGGLVNVAKKLKGVKSQYRLEIEADVEGTRLHPFDKLVLEVE
jgi:hypothetical protein